MAGTEGNKSITQGNLQCVLAPHDYKSYIGSGTSATDISTNLETITLSGVGYSEPELTLDGLNDYVDMDNVFANVSSDTTGTVSFWCKPTDATPAATETLFSAGDTDANEYMLFDMLNSGKLRVSCRIPAGGRWSFTSDAMVFADNTWTFVTISHNGTLASMYINGASEAATYTTTTDQTVWFSGLAGLDNLRYGCRNYNSGGNTNFLTGSLGEFLYSNTAYSAGDISNDYEATRAIYGV